MKLKIADNFSLPLEAVTQTFGILGKRGGGKSYTAKVMAEEMIKANAHVCAVDPIGNWWGLRLAADGKSPGLPITVLGGEYGDVPIEASEKAGEFVARLIIEEKLSVVIDVSQFRKHEQTSFMIGWAETLYRLNREALHLFIDEADAWAPQRPLGNLAPRLLGAMEDLVRRGRARGLGITMITQRSASINKDLLTQIEVLIAKRTIAPQDRDAIEAWVKVHGTPEQKQTLMESLPSLPKEKAWFWSPGWLDLFKQVDIRKLKTFDSSATPEVGAHRVSPKRLAQVDLEKLQARMAETIERAKQEDPRELRKQVAELKKQLAAKPTAAAPSDIKADRLKAEYEKGLQAERRRIASELGKSLPAIRQRLDKVLGALGDQPLREIDTAIELLKRSAPIPTVAPAHRSRLSEMASVQVGPLRVLPNTASHRSIPHPAAVRETVAQNGSLPEGERAVLTAIAQHTDGVQRDQLSVLTGYRRSTRDTYIQRLNARGYVDLRGGAILATQEGISALGDGFNPLPTGRELQAYWIERLPEGEAKILRVLISAHPNAIDRSVLDVETGYKRSSRDTYIQRLTARRLVIAEGRGSVRASDSLF